ncbi:flagellar basal body-associated FliL family protein [Actinomadura hibisca]|uniref:flagellar basal body-associated FliL family protein n=1 Tax=Actinomadura hibisca TaxID=68565 RepID=UPI0008315054|nr:flagellar basal body-associated FliL family protein [Actinomadura hibisca]
MAATAKLSAAPDADKAAEGGGRFRKKKKLIIIGGAVGLLVVAAAVYLLLFSGGEEKKAEPKPGAVVALESITINLQDGHYLKLKLALQATAEAHEPPEGSRAQDLAVDAFSNRTMTELTADKARQQLKEDLLKKVKKAYNADGAEEVMDLYFTEFVMQ